MGTVSTYIWSFSLNFFLQTPSLLLWWLISSAQCFFKAAGCSLVQPPPPPLQSHWPPCPPPCWSWNSLTRQACLALRPHTPSHIHTHNAVTAVVISHRWLLPESIIAVMVAKWFYNSITPYIFFSWNSTVRKNFLFSMICLPIYLHW